MEVLKTLCLFFSRLLYVYSMIIWLRVILTWIIRNPRPGSFMSFFAFIVDPYVDLFRSRRARNGLDFSYLAAIAVVTIVQSLLSIFGTYGRLTFAMTLYVFLQSFWAYGLSILLLVCVIDMIVKTVGSFSANPYYNNYAYQGISSISGPIRDMVRSLIYPKTGSNEKVVNVVSMILSIAIYIMANVVFEYVAKQVLRIPF